MTVLFAVINATANAFNGAAFAQQVLFLRALCQAQITFTISFATIERFLTLLALIDSTYLHCMFKLFEPTQILVHCDLALVYDFFNKCKHLLLQVEYFL